MQGKKKPLDTKGYYRLLKVAPDAPQDELSLAAAMAKSSASPALQKRIDEAYKVLRDPKKRAAYNMEGIRGFEPLRSPATLVAAVVILIGIFVWLWLPEIRKRNKSFSTGQTLVETRTNRVFGEVIRFEARHEFPGGVTAPAYLVKLGEHGSERWFPAIDLQATCDVR